MNLSPGYAAMIALALLTACNGSDDANSGVTAEESLALNEVENMLDSSPRRLIAGDNISLDNEATVSDDDNPPRQ
jgi:hypothetical protein